MSDYQIVIPNGNITNIITNPSVETGTTGFATINGTETISQNTTQQKYGAYALKVETTAAAATEGVVYTQASAVSASTEYTLAVWARATSANFTVYLRARNQADGANLASAQYDLIAGTWTRMEVTFTTDVGQTSLVWRVTSTETTARTFNIDAFDCVLGATAYTHIDGDQPGCEWNGTPHASTSTLSGASRAGGIVYDLVDDLELDIEGVMGWGSAPRAVSQDGYAQLPGGKTSASVRTTRPFTITGLINADTQADYHDIRKALWDAINPESYPKTADGWQPARLRYSGGTTAKQCAAQYVAGMDGQRTAQGPFVERIALAFSADDPNWYEIGDSAAHLDTNDSATLRYVAGRLKSTGQWDDLGLTANPTNGGGESGYVLDALYSRNRVLYIGGDWDGLNGDTPAGMDFVAKFTPGTETWAVLVGAADVNGYVRRMAEGPDGKIYLVGDFTAVNGVATADYVVVYDPSTNTWSSLGDPDSGGAAITSVNACAFDNDGNFYVGGNFTDFAGVANADYFAKWNGAAWVAVGSGGTGTVSAIAIDDDGNIFIGGSFTNWAADGNADYWAWWDGSAWAAVDDIALSSYVLNMVFDDIGNLYVGGNFTNVDSVAEADYIFRWTGTAVEALGTGLDAAVFKITIAPDGILWAGGAFDATGDQAIDFINGIAVWNGSTWSNPDLQSTGGVVRAIAISQSDKTVAENYDVYIGTQSSGAAYFSGDTTVTNDGTVPAYPDIVFARSGGTSARLISVRNWTTGKELYFNYSLLNGETLTISTHPDKQSAESSVFGSRADAVLEGSDIADFCLLPGANLITAFIDVAGAPTITAYMLWKDAYDGVDD